MNTIKAKLLLSLVVLVALTAIITVVKVGEYSTSQEYAKTAADQLDDYTGAYKALKTQQGVMESINWVRLASVIVALFVLVVIWIPRKAKKKVNKKVGKVY